MVCGTATTEALTAVTRATATQFQMQRATNCAMAPPFPTRLEYGQLLQWYNTIKKRGYPTQPSLNRIANTLGINQKEVRTWFAKERKIRGHDPAGP